MADRSAAGRAISLMHAAAITTDDADRAGDDPERVISCLLTVQFWCEEALSDLRAKGNVESIARRFAPKLPAARQLSEAQ